jgi:hypothetical protein
MNIIDLLPTTIFKAILWMGTIYFVYLLIKGKGYCSHEWKQMGGSTNVGGGEFRKTFTCRKCYKTKYEIS